MPDIEDAEIGCRSPKHRVAHDARLRSAHHDAVHDEGHGAGYGDQDDPYDIPSGDLHDRRGVCGRIVDEQPHQVAPPDDVDSHEQYRHGRAPCDAAPQAVAQRLYVPGADEPSGQRFGGICEAVVHVREEREELQQQGVHGQQHRVFHAGRSPREEGVDRHDAERTQHDVAVDDEEGFERFHVEYLSPVDARQYLAVAQHEQQQRKSHARPLCDHRGVGNADDPHVHAEGEPKAAQDMHHVDRNSREHRYHGILHTREPAVEPEQEDASRYGPDAGVEIRARHFVAIESPQGQLAQRVLQGEHQQSHARRHDHRPYEHVGAFAEIPGAERLCRESAGSHAHERAVPVDEVENRHPDGQCADRRRRIRTPVPGDGRRHDSHQRYGDV